jgi:hypothetical protein
VHLLFAGNLVSADTWNPIDEGKYTKTWENVGEDTPKRIQDHARQTGEEIWPRPSLSLFLDFLFH